MKKQAIFIFVILMLACGIGLWRDKISSHNGVTSWGKSSSLLVGTALPMPQAVPAFSLQDRQGQVFTEMALKQHWSIMVFGYTQCPEICPAILKSMTEIQQHLKPKTQIESVFVTIDPEHDTVDRLNTFFQQDAYKAYHMQALTGPKASIQALAEQVGLHLEAATKDATHIGHSGTMLLINPEGKIAALFTRVDEPSAIARDVKNLMHRYRQG